jgi:hypothetical protein
MLTGYRSRGSGSIPLRFRIFWEVVGLDPGSLSLIIRTIVELLERKCSGYGLENRDYARRESAALTTRHPYIRER